jgi:hypothetical protein
MNSSCATEALRVAAHQLDCSARARERAARDHHVSDPNCVRAADHVRSIVVETVVAEVDADVDELVGQGANLRQAAL